jgi:hypothetical protein
MEPEGSFSIHNGPTLVPILSQMNPDHISTSYFRKIHFNIIFLSTPMTDIQLRNENKTKSKLNNKWEWEVSSVSMALFVKIFEKNQLITHIFISWYNRSLVLFSPPGKLILQ